MFISHWLQSIELENSEERYIVNFTDLALTETLFNKTFDCRAKILAVIPKLKPNSNYYILEDAVMLDIIYLNLDKGNKIMLKEITRYGKYDKIFGFDYTWDEMIHTLMSDIGVVYDKGTVLATTTADSNGVYKFGVNAKVASLTTPELSDDAIIISESFAEKISFGIYRTIKVNIDYDSLPLIMDVTENGDIKIFPDIDKEVNGYICAIRNIDPIDYPTLLSVNGLKEINRNFDKYYEGSGTVVDIDVIKTVDSKIPQLDFLFDQVDTYERISSTYRRNFIEAVNTIIDQFPNNEIDGMLHVKLNNFVKIEDDRFINVYNQDPMPLYQITITIKEKMKPNFGFKLSNMHGAKGVIGGIIPDKDMPVDANGLRADMLLSVTAPIKRMSIGLKYEGYITTAAYIVDKKLKKMIDELDGDNIVSKLTNNDISHIKSYILGFLEIASPRQYNVYVDLVDKDFIEMLITNYNNHLQVWIELEDDLEAIVLRLFDSPYAIKDDYFEYTLKDKKVKSVNRGHIEVIYTMLINKIVSNFLVVSTARLNQFGIPISPSRAVKDRMIVSESPVKILSETESRMIAAYAGSDALLEIRDRSLNLDALHNMYYNLLSVDTPTNVESIIDRDRYPIKPNIVNNIVDSLLNTVGINIISPDIDVKPVTFKKSTYRDMLVDMSWIKVDLTSTDELTALNNVVLQIPKELGLPIKESYYFRNNFTNGYFSSGTIPNVFKAIASDIMFYTDIDIAVYGKKVLEFINFLYLEYILKSKEYYLSITLKDILDIQNYPELLQAIDKVKLNPSPNSIADSYKKFREIMFYEMFDDNMMSFIYNSAVVSAKQVNQCLVMRGYVSDLDSTIYSTPITDSYTKGISSVEYMAMESRGAAISLYYSTTTIGDSEAFAKKTHLVASFVERLDYTDCGTLDGLEYVVTEDIFNNVIGQMYRFHSDTEWKLIYPESKDIIGKSIILRTALSCKHPNNNTICINCYGKFGRKLPKDILDTFNLGLYSATFFNEPASQSLLSTKHHIVSADGTKFTLTSAESVVLKVVDNKIYLANGIKRVYIKIPQRELNITTLSINNAMGVDTEKLSRITHIIVGYVKYGKVFEVDVVFKKGGLYAVITNVFLQHIATKGYEFDNDYIKVSMVGFPKDSKNIFYIPEKVFDYNVLNTQLRGLIASLKSPQGEYIKRADRLLLETFKLFNSKLSVHIAPLAVIVYSLTVRNQIERDFRLTRGVDAPVGTLATVLSGRSLTTIFGYGTVKYMLRPSMFIPKGKQDNILDVVLKPKGK
jgi:hypothetical protein